MAYILQVDDDMVQRVLLKRALGQAGHEIESADSGERALDAFARRAPDLVLADVQMGGIDGFEMVRRIRGEPAGAQIPVLFFTGVPDAQARLAGFNFEADEFLPKGTPMPDVVRAVRRALERARAARERTFGVFQKKLRLAGDLSESGAAALLTAAAANRADGELVIQGVRSVTVIFAGGAVVAASVAGEPALVGAEAVRLCLCWGAGSYRFRPRAAQADEKGPPLPLAELVRSAACRPLPPAR